MSHLQGHDKGGLLLVVGVHKVPVAVLAQHVGLQGQVQVAMAGRPELLPPHIRQHSPVDALTMSQIGTCHNYLSSASLLVGLTVCGDPDCGFPADYFCTCGSGRLPLACHP